MSLNCSEIENILQAKNFSKLNGQFESEFLDVKGEIYDFANIKKDNKYELCKDASSLANHKGGFIILGIIAKKLEGKPHEKIESVNGIDASKINKQTYIQHLEQGVYPKITSLCSFEFTTLDGKDIFYIKVSQALDNKPFLVRKGEYFSYWIRTETHGLQESVERVHEAMRQGFHYQEYLGGMDKKIDELLTVARRPENHAAISPSPNALEELYKEL